MELNPHPKPVLRMVADGCGYNNNGQLSYQGQFGQRGCQAPVASLSDTNSFLLDRCWFSDLEPLTRIQELGVSNGSALLTPMMQHRYSCLISRLEGMI